MSPTPASPTNQFVADIQPVREVTLVGSADLNFWKQRLENEDLTPIERDGKAQLLIIAAAMRFKGIRFRELSFSVLVRRKQTEAAFLVQAFNTVRFFAFVERNLFSTPYCHGDVQLDVGAPAFARAADRSGGSFSAEMANDPDRRPERIGDNGWEGDVLLPRRGNQNATRKHFVARIRGETRSYRFISEDRIKIQPSAQTPIFQWLLDSKFAGQEWSIRESARHCKSKTMADRFPPAG